MRLFRFSLPMLIVIFLSSLVFAQSQLPDPIQIHRLIKSTTNERAGDIRWIEVWESRSGMDREWVMIDAQGSVNGVEYTCHHALAIGGGAPLYVINDEYVPVDNAETLFSEIENRRLVDQSELYIAGVSCESNENDIVNGFPAEKCTFENVDASGLFLVKPPASSRGELWTAIDGGFPVQYHFFADGSTGTVEHQYDVSEPSVNFSIQPPQTVDLMCFDSGFPLGSDTRVTSTGLSYAIIESEQSQSELQLYFDEQLIPDWAATGNLAGGGRSYSRVMDSGSTCSLNMRYGEGRNNTTLVSINVYPEFVNVESFELPDDFTSPVVIQNAFNASLVVEGNIQDALNQLMPSLEGQGWVQRPELTDIREDSAFVTLSQGQYEMHIIADKGETNTTVQIQTRTAICGPVFEMSDEE